MPSMIRPGAASGASSTRRPIGDRHSLRRSGGGAMRAADIRRCWSDAGLQIERQRGHDAGDDAGGFQRGCFRRRAARCTAAARTDGRRRSSGRARGRKFRACIWRAAARIRGRACRWRRCRAASAAAQPASRTSLRRAVPHERLCVVVCRRAERRRRSTASPSSPSSAACSRPITRSRGGSGPADPLNHCAINVAVYRRAAAIAGR